jgi:peptide chain release factor 1, archaeal and eukaryotic forms
MSDTTKEYEMKKSLKKLRSIRGYGTELISIYVPPDFQISDEVNKLREEKNQSSNIKSKTTRQNVQNAIEKIVQYLKLYNRPPKNGIAVFCGNISKMQDKPDIRLFSIEPPVQIKANIYRCDSNFLLSPIEALFETTELYGILIMDGRDAIIGMLRGTQFFMEKKVHSFAHQKVNKGGQSQARFERIRVDSIEHYYQSIGGAVNEMFEKNSFKISGLIVGGPGPTKENFVKSKNLNYQIKVLGVFDTGYTDENVGMRELLEHAKELLSEQSIIKEQKLIGRLKSEIARNGNAATGYQHVKSALENGKVETLIISEDAEIYKVKYKCNTCGKEIERIIQGDPIEEKHDCGGYLQIVESVDVVEELVEMADKGGVGIHFISSEGEYGKELLLGFGGIAALLR